LGIASEPLCVLAAQPLLVEPSQQEAACQQLSQRLAVHSAAVRSHSAVALVGGAVYGIFAGRDADDASRGPVVGLAEEFVARRDGVDVVVGIGRSVPRQTEVGRSRIDADHALRVLRHEALQLGSRQRVARFADVQSRSLLLRLADLAAEDGEVLAGPLGALSAYDAEHRSGLVDTIAAYLDAFGDVASGAAVLHIHPNTFRYRLRRATEISGLDLSDPESRLAVMLQLRLRRAAGS
jgi:sugar diacid utilization regulator